MSSYVKLAVIVTALVGLALAQEGAPAQPTQVSGDRVVIEAGAQRAVSAAEFQGDFERFVRELAFTRGIPLNEQTRPLFDRFQLPYLQQRAAEEALLMEAEQRGIQVPNDLVSARVEQVRQQFASQEQFLSVLRGLEYEGEEQFQQAVRRDLTVERTVERIAQEIEPTEDQLQAYYQQHQAAFQQPFSEVRAQVRAQYLRQQLGERIAELREKHAVQAFPERLPTGPGQAVQAGQVPAMRQQLDEQVPEPQGQVGAVLQQLNELRTEIDRAIEELRRLQGQ